MLQNALLLDIRDFPLSRRVAQILLIIHALGLVAIVRFSHEWLWAGLPIIWFAIPAYISLSLSSPRLYLETLTPMGLAYGVIGIRVLLVIIFQLQIVTDSGLTEFDRYGNFLDITTATIVSLLWIIAIQLVILVRHHGIDVTWWRGLRWLAYGLILLSAIWAAWAYLAIRADGVTASDPYAYVQMGYDLATTGSLEHMFDLSSIAVQNDLERGPLAPIGYKTPDAETGDAATVWAPGYAAFLAIAYLIGGETGFYWVTPLSGLLSLLAVIMLTREVLRRRPDHERWLASAIAAFILATSLLQVLWLAVPMADIPSQLFTTLSVYFALMTVRSKTWLTPFLTGVCLGIAFAIRYTQVLVGVSIVAGWVCFYLYQKKDLHSWVKVMLPAAIGAWLMALPVLSYHALAFGGPFYVGSEELEIFGTQFILDSGWRMIQDAFSVEEFLLLIPFIVWGALRLWQINRLASIFLNLWFIAIVVFHLPYAALRLRDLLSVFPVLVVYSGLGIVDLLNHLSNVQFPKTARALFIWVVIIVLWARTEDTLSFIDGVYNNFGYLNEEQRDSFDVIRELTIKDTIIAASLNSGPVILYSERNIVRPYDWQPEEWFTFIDNTTARDLYLLIDGVEMQQIFDITSQRYTLEPVTHLPMPYFFIGGGSENQLVTLYRLKRD